MLTSPRQICLFDGDKLEPKNLDRQLFTDSDLGKNKAEALGERYGTHTAEGCYYHSDRMPHESNEWLFCCADNHTARREVLRSCDRYGCRAIIAANETYSAEAYYYMPFWMDSQLDPRVYYPEIVSDRSGDPMARAIGCTGEAQAQTPQLVSANFIAAALAQHLFVLWAMEAPKMSKEVHPKLPYKLVSNLSKIESFKIESQLVTN